MQSPCWAPLPHNPRGRRLALPAFLDFSLVFNPRDLCYRGYKKEKKRNNNNNVTMTSRRRHNTAADSRAPYTIVHTVHAAT